MLPANEEEGHDAEDTVPPEQGHGKQRPGHRDLEHQPEDQGAPLLPQHPAWLPALPGVWVVKPLLLVEVFQLNFLLGPADAAPLLQLPLICGQAGCRVLLDFKVDLLWQLAHEHVQLSKGHGVWVANGDVQHTVQATCKNPGQGLYAFSVQKMYIDLHPSTRVHTKE